MDLTPWNHFDPEHRLTLNTKAAVVSTKTETTDELSFYSMAEIDSAESFTDEFLNVTSGFFDSVTVK
jgi:hypothetical protein